jgi:hypothetical protein
MRGWACKARNAFSSSRARLSTIIYQTQPVDHQTHFQQNEGGYVQEVSVPVSAASGLLEHPGTPAIMVTQALNSIAYPETPPQADAVEIAQDTNLEVLTPDVVIPVPDSASSAELTLEPEGIKEVVAPCEAAVATASARNEAVAIPDGTMG